jgi:phosphatidylglycerophosphatase A
MRTALLTAFGLGLLKPAPGTWGSTPPAALAGVLLMLGFRGPVYFGAIAALGLVAGASCVLFGGFGERRFGGKDASPIVADEVAGMCLPLLVLPLFAGWLGFSGGHGHAGTWRVLLGVGGAFVLFRAFDILKPPPANALQQLPAGWGVLLDDLAAGLYAAATLAAGLLLLQRLAA